MVRMKGDVSIGVSSFPTERCEQSIWAPSDLYIEKSHFAFLPFFGGELYVEVLLIDVFIVVAHCSLTKTFMVEMLYHCNYCTCLLHDCSISLSSDAVAMSLYDIMGGIIQAVCLLHGNIVSYYYYYALV